MQRRQDQEENSRGSLTLADEGVRSSLHCYVMTAASHVLGDYKSWWILIERLKHLDSAQSVCLHHTFVKYAPRGHTHPSMPPPQRGFVHLPSMPGVEYHGSVRKKTVRDQEFNSEESWLQSDDLMWEHPHTIFKLWCWPEPYCAGLDIFFLHIVLSSTVRATCA